MAIPRTSLLDLPLPVTGSLSGDWGAATNNGLTEYLDIAVAGSLVLNTDADVTLTSTDGDENGTNIGSTTAQYAILRWTATGSTTRNITVPAKSKTYIVINATGGTQSIVLRGAGPTTGVTIVSGEKAVCAWNGSDFVKVGGAAGGTNTQVQYNNNGVFGGSADLTWDGSTLVTTGLTASGAVTLSATSQNIALGTSQVGGTWTAGGASQTGAITLDQSTKTHTLNIGTGATENALTKTINLGTAGVSGSTTTINIGSAVSGATSSTSVNGALTATGNVSFDGGSFVFNESGADKDFRIEGDTDANLFFTDASTDRVGIGTSSPTQKLDVAGQVTISSGNGYLWGNGAVQIYSNLSYLRFRTASTDRLEIDSSGNLGLGVTPSAWSSGYKAIEFGSGSIYGRANATDIYLASNSYLGASTFIYKYTGAASYYAQALGGHYWFNAPSGTAGNAITFTQAMTLDASGNLVVGFTSGNYRLTAARAAGGTQLAVTTATAGGSSASPLNIDIDFLGYNDETKARIRASDASANTAESPLAFWTKNSAGTLAERARITSGGDLQIANGNLVMSTSGKGIDFSATSSGTGTMTSELLSDYEEGTFLPTIASGVSTAPTSYTFQLGRYTKIGRYVFFQIDIDSNGAVGDAGALQIGGLPFTVGFYGAASVGYQESFNTNASDTYLASGTTIAIYTNTGASRSGNAAGVDINKRIILSGCYIV